MTGHRLIGARVRVALTAIALIVLLVLVGAPLLGWPRVVRLPAVLVPALAIALVMTRPWRWPDLTGRAVEWQPSGRFVLTAALSAGSLLLWYVLTRFQSGEINAVDFTIYFDRPCFQTAQGRALWVETSDTPGFSNRSEFADHAYWAMLPICSLYAVSPSPLWLHAISAMSIAAGAFYVLRILQQLGAGGVLACASALAFILNDNTARTLNYGFHPEVLYAWLIPWMLEAGMRGARKSFVVAMLACVLVKEDACLPIFAVSVALALYRFPSMTRAERRLFLILPNVLALANLAVYYRYVMPLLTGESGLSYAHFWANYGDTPMLALLGMASHPVQVMASLMTSGIIRVLMPHLFLPLVGWRWVLGIVPIVAIYGASVNDQVRDFGIYYPIVLVPFLIIAASSGALRVARRVISNDGYAQLAAAGIVLSGALLVGSWHRGYSLRPWRAEIAAVPEALTLLSSEPIVLVQSGLFPHAGYDVRFKLLTPETLGDPRHKGVAVILAPHIGAYPFGKEDLASLRDLAPIRPMPGGLVAIRLSQAVVIEAARFAPKGSAPRHSGSPSESRGRRR